MTSTEDDSKLRKHIHGLSKERGTLVDNLWRTLRPIHDDQNKTENDGTENGRPHVCKVEDNIWRLIHKCAGLGLKSFQQIEELVVLSAAACCHDIDKAVRKYGLSNWPHTFQHGSGSSEFVMNNHQLLGFSGPEDRALVNHICDLCAIHSLKEKPFDDEFGKLSRKAPTSSGSIDLCRAALLLKVADILHTDGSRVRSLGFNPDLLSGILLSKYRARQRIRGWDIDGQRVTIISDWETDAEHKALCACKEYMEKTEWPSVGKMLKAFGLPYVLDFRISQQTRGIVPMPNTERIRMDRSRNITMELAEQVLSVVANPPRNYICKNEYATHAVAATAFLLAARDASEKAKVLKNTFQSFLDLSWEEDFSFDKLQEQIIVLSELRSRLKQFLCRPVKSSLCIVDDAHKPKPSNTAVVKDVLSVLPSAAKIVNETLPEVYEEFSNELNKLNVVLGKVGRKISRMTPAKAEQARKDTKRFYSIKKALKAFYGPLRAMKEIVVAVSEDLDQIAAQASEDLNNDVHDLQLFETCKTDR